MSSGMTNFLGNEILNLYLVDAGKWLALHLSDPGVAGSGATEMIGGGYTRMQVDWSVPSNRSVANTNSFRFLNLPGGTVTYFGIWDSNPGGNLLYRIQLPTPVVVTAGQYFTVPVNDIAVVLN